MADLAASLNRMSIAHRPPLRWALMLIASMLVVVGCSQFDYQLRIANESDQVWLVRVSVGGSYGEEQFVRRLQPGAEGLALQWNETRTPTLELLREDCSIGHIRDCSRWISVGSCRSWHQRDNRALPMERSLERPRYWDHRRVWRNHNALTSGVWVRPGRLYWVLIGRS